MTNHDDNRAQHRSGEPDGGDGDAPRTPSAAERITLAISSALVLAVVGLLIYLQATGGDEPPTFAASPLLAGLRHADDAWYLPIAVANRGDDLAEQVLVRAELTDGAGPAHTAEFTIEMLPGGESAEGVAVFPADPLSGELTVQVASYR